MKPTADATLFHQEVAQVLAKLDGAISRFTQEDERESTQDRPLSVATCSTFFSQWIRPRLSGLERYDADLSAIRFRTLGYPNTFLRNADAAVTHQPFGEPASRILPLFREELLLVSAKEYAIRAKFDLSEHNLFWTASRQNLWPSWSRKFGVVIDPKRYCRVEHYFFVIEAVLRGWGLGLVPKHYIAEAIAAGDIKVWAYGKPIPGAAYYWVDRGCTQKALQRFLDWLREELGAPQLGRGAL